MKKRNGFKKINKVILTLVIGAVMSGSIFLSFQEIRKEVESKRLVPVVARRVSSREQIKEEDIVMIEVPKYILLDGVVTSKEELIGNYVRPYHTLVENSLFYKESIVSQEKMNDVALFSLNKGEVAITVEVDIQTSYANSILVGHLIDLYYLGTARLSTDDQKAILQGAIVKNARVLSVKDKDGISIEGNPELKTAMIVVALSDEDAHLIEVAKALGKVYPIISHDNFNIEESAAYYDLDKIKNLLLGNTWDVVIEALEEIEHE